jgi:hypothetical protein
VRLFGGEFGLQKGRDCVHNLGASKGRPVYQREVSRPKHVDEKPAMFSEGNADVRALYRGGEVATALVDRAVSTLGTCFDAFLRRWMIVDCRG